MITKNESKDEENNTEDNSDTSDDVDEMFNFLESIIEKVIPNLWVIPTTRSSTNLSDGWVTRVDIWSKGSNTSHDSIITTSDNDTSGRTFNTIGGEKCQVLCFKDSCCWICVVTCLKIVYHWPTEYPINGCYFSYLWFRFTSEGGVVDFHVWWLNNSQISWDTVSAFDFNDITKDKSSSQNSFLFTATDSKGLLWYHVFEGFHNCIGFWFLNIPLEVIRGQHGTTYLVVLENTGDNDDSREDDTEI